MKKQNTYKGSYQFKFILGVLLLAVLPCLSVNVKAATDGTLTIRKFQVENYENLKQGTGQESNQVDVPENAEAMENIEFKVEKLLVNDIDKEVTISAPIDASYEAKIQRTDTNGETKFEDLEKGYYLVTENIPSGYNAPQAGKFVVSIPMETKDSEGNKTVNYDVVVYPKSQKVQIEKEAIDTKEVVGVGSIVKWNVKYPLGPDLKRVETIGGTTNVSYAKGFYLTDTMDTRLDYVPGSVVFSYFDANGSEIAGLNLTEGTDYILTYNASSHMLKIEFTDGIGTNKIADANVATIMMALETVVNESAIDTVKPIGNNAKIHYINEAGDPYEHEVFPDGTDTDDPRVPKVYLGQIVVTKVDAKTKERLADATFGLADSVKDAKDGNFIKRVKNGAESDIIITTDNNGEAAIKALEAGTYYLMETKAPSGYTKITEAIQVTIANDGNANVTRISIDNPKEGSQEPSKEPSGTPNDPAGNPTGIPTVAKGTGMTPKTGDTTRIVGLTLLAVASIGMLVIVNRKGKKKRSK